MSSSIDTFLVGRVSADTLAAMDSATKAKVARALGMPVACATVAIVAYEPEKAKTGLGQFLSLAVEGSRNNIFLRLCNGPAMDDAGRAKARAVLEAVVSEAQALLAALK